MTLALPPGYEGRSIGGVDAFAWSAALPWMESILAARSSIHDWASVAADSEPMSGRGTVYSVPAPAPGPDRQTRWAVRHYHRGGLLASSLDDRYLRSGLARPVRELWASDAARTRGIDTPAVVAGAVYRSGIFYRADLVTDLVPDAVDLAHLLFGGHPRHDVHAALRATGQLIRALETARVLHADLNAKNVLLVSDGALLHAHILDLDRCEVLPLHRRPPRRAMRRRLRRSLKKLGELHGRPLADSEWSALETCLDHEP